ncbi:hypothetical protein KKA02_04670, partial [Patescibacteria group bacterium]|nr:hypothetical protein [Patescibacteria group bacterium]
MKLPAFFKTKFFSFLSWLLVIVLIFLFSFFLWRRFYPSIPQISSTVQAVELPSGIKPKDLGNLSLQQQQQLDQAISLSIEKQLATNPFLKENQPAIIVLTHNNQPILPDLNSNQSLSSPAVPTTASRDLSTPTVKPSSTSIPTPIPATSTPTNIPCADTDGGKDYFTKGTLTTSYGDTYTDFCSDPTIISEYY